jgi:crotonobetainyl-CoA:carnitine CoA-transferase CaiB-like acyl-CoA transferase
MTDWQHGTEEKPMPLKGIKIVEYGVFHAGPGGTAILGDLGAEIIKVESGFGDP